jgi:hypothetical protein
MKSCARCDVCKPCDQFTRNRACPDGIDRYCRECNRAKCREAGRRRRAAETDGDREARREWHRRYYRDRIRSDPERYASHLEKGRASHKRARRSAIHQLVADKRHRRSRYEGFDLTPEWADGQLSAQGGRCYWTGILIDQTGEDWMRKPSLDRLVPGGPYSQANTVVACMFANIGRSDYDAAGFSAFLSELAESLPSRPHKNR